MKKILLILFAFIFFWQKGMAQFQPLGQDDTKNSFVSTYTTETF